MTVTHPLAIAWLERVERLAADLPADVRAELLADLRDHLDAAVPADADGAEVGRVLDRLGDPAEVVAAARPDGSSAVSAPPPTPPAVPSAAPSAPEGLLAQEVVALAALVLAGVIGIFVWPLTILLWATGIAMVAVAGRWRGGEVVAMILLPVAWTLPVLSLVVPVRSSSGSCTMSADGIETCSMMEQSGVPGGAWVLVAVIAALVAIILGTRWLARAPRGRPTRS